MSPGRAAPLEVMRGRGRRGKGHAHTSRVGAGQSGGDLAYPADTASRGPLGAGGDAATDQQDSDGRHAASGERRRIIPDLRVASRARSS